MGRAVLMSAYGLIKLLHSAACSGLPADAARDIARAILPGVPVQRCGGRPRDGGFGLLLLLEHTAARRVALAVRYAK
eukprot:218769-Chlamydomonas_euryale.AAC.1